MLLDHRTYIRDILHTGSVMLTLTALMCQSNGVIHYGTFVKNKQAELTKTLHTTAAACTSDDIDLTKVWTKTNINIRYR